MNHPYQTYIETKAADYYSRQAHEPHCETLQSYRVPTNERTGETYDVYIIQHCDCWIKTNFDALTLERKFQAMRALSHRYGLHSPACSRLKRTPITYRGRREIMTGWCDCWLSVDIRPESPVEYEHSQPTPTKGHTMSDIKTDLIIAKSRADELRNAQNSIDTFLAPFIKDYADFMSTENPRGFDLRDFTADTFTEIDYETFSITGEEEYSYGEYYTPTLNLPFAFVEDSEAYKADFRKTQAEIKAKQDAKAKTAKAEQVARLKLQLARAEAELAKADTQRDPIKTIATRNQAQKLRTQFMDS